MKFKLNKKVKRKWVKALRSGKYKQGTGVLSRGGYYCCLGVACKIGISEKAKDGYQLASADFLPFEIQEKLANMNDGENYLDNYKKWNFKEIADYIDKNL